MIRDDDDSKNIKKNKEAHTVRLFLSIIAMMALVGAPASMAFATTTSVVSSEEEDVIETQNTAIEDLTEDHRDVNGIEFTPRWGAVVTIEPDTEGVLFADCNDDEFAVASQYIFESSDVVASESFPVALVGDSMTWVVVVQNTHNTDDKAAAVGVICAGENDGDEGADDLNIRTKITIDNIVKNFIRVENNQIVNLNNIINIRQQIVQNAIQVLSITGNNNTVNQVINQSATQIAAANVTNPVDIQQIIDQEAQQQGVISGTGNQTSLSQVIEQEALQQANITGGVTGPTTLEQLIEQQAAEGANVTTGAEAELEQQIDQNATQQALIEQQEQQQLEEETAIDQAIQQQAEQEALVEEQEDELVGNSTG